MMSANSTLAVTHAVTLAKEVDPDKVTPGLLGFVVFAVMAGAVWLLMKSMNKHMRNVDFTETPKEAEKGSDGGTAASEADTATDGRTAGAAKGRTAATGTP
ncbi:hypothetical protein ACFV3R_20340 [Streptomyces sp. NPDC059740]|uniref:hypothetical protein n=1 Tax=Streptomyces sp. NPDC059740 TaxID=3346926 RepID=UPI00364DDFD0